MVMVTAQRTMRFVVSGYSFVVADGPAAPGVRSTTQRLGSTWKRTAVFPGAGWRAPKKVQVLRP
jgi:hypothetical protein